MRSTEGVPVVEPTTATASQLAGLKGHRTISVVLPAKDEEATVGQIVTSIVENLATGHQPPLVDEVVVIDDGSVDSTASAARAAGARVEPEVAILPSAEPGTGKGNVLWKSLAATTGDIIVWCDSDLTSFSPEFVTRLVAPLLTDDHIAFVKGFYERPLDEAGQGGGRTTELVARPLLSAFFPGLATLKQPLGGEVAATRELLEQIPFVQSYGTESAMLIDTARLAGLQAMAQVDLGIRRHRHRPLSELSIQAAEILAVILARAGVVSAAQWPPLVDVEGARHPVEMSERPPMLTVAEYQVARPAPAASS